MRIEYMTKRKRKKKFFYENACSNFYGIFDYLPNRKIEREREKPKRKT
jgi:hypothetical protein